MPESLSSRQWPFPAIARPNVRVVSLDEQAVWLAAGWADLRASPGVSLAYGALFVAAGYAVSLGLLHLGLGSLILPLLGAFLLVGPFAAVGLYEISRGRERGEAVGLAQALRAWNRNGPQIAGFGLMLMLAVLAWVQIALLLFMLFFHAGPPPLEHFLSALLTAPQAPLFLLLGTVVGGALAALVFTVSAVSLPLLMDREDVGVAAAIATSIDAVARNWRVMIGWAAVIALLIGLGLATFFIGLAVTLPLAGHASWHAYRGLVSRQ
ncbi:MAG: DUF2189 domain-containing protein [Rhodospirillales bacterium]|nr:DUF2189 domain-containing protein [Rhodospirillales bacterium]